MGGAPVVLLVDDEPSVLSALRRALRREGLAIETAANAAQALERIESGPTVALVISDHKMPGMTGLEMLTRIRRLAPDTARILLSGWVGEIARSELAAADLHAVHAKPWDDGALKASIRAALGRAT